MTGSILYDNTVPGTYVNTIGSGASILLATGTIISFQVAGGAGTQVGIAALRPAGSAGFSAIAASPLTRLSSTGISPRIPVSVPFSSGDRVALNVGDGPSPSVEGSYGYIADGGEYRYIIPPLVPGGPPASGAAALSSEVAYNAVIRFCVVPNVKGMRLSKARAALRASDCTPGKVTPKKKKRKGKVVVGLTPEPVSQVSDTFPIAIHLGKKKH